MQTVIKDPYSLEAFGTEFGDYVNEFIDILAGISSNRYTDKNIKKILAKNPLKQVEARFAVYYDNYPDSKQAVINHPVKVAHINQMAKLANACGDVSSLKPILNEILRLIYGKAKELPFPEKEFDPQLVSIKQ